MKFEVRNICCIGAGYVGGPTMAVIANMCPNIQVNVIDLNEKRINQWNNDNLSNLPIFEPGLKELIETQRGKNLHFSTDIKKHIEEADMIFICVNTPTKEKGIGAGKASDLKWIESSARTISKFGKGKTIIVEKSTIPVKTADTIKVVLDSSIDQTKNNNKSRNEFTVLSNPEFLAEGTAIRDLKNPDRVLIGGSDQDSINALREIYSRWVDKEKILTTNVWSSELSKLTANAFLAQRVSSINSISAICEKTGANINEVSQAIGMDSRLGNKFLKSGPGFGGSCFKKDILNLIYISDYYGLNEVSKYWEQVIEINDWQKKRLNHIILDKLFGTISEKKIAILGFAFKANTNDTRESPAINICLDLIEEGAKLSIYDPKVTEESINEELKTYRHKDSKNKKGWEFSKSIDATCMDADAIIILTEWEEFRCINWNKISTLMRKPSWLFDTRGIVNSSEARKNNINTWVTGKGVNIN